jgi:hypothetical protein
MPVHEWSRVPACIFYALQHSWIVEISKALNRILSPEDYYALKVPPIPPTAETNLEPYRGKQSVIAIHRVNGDRVVAMIEIALPSNCGLPALADQPLTLTASESGSIVRTYVVQVIEGQTLPDMPLHLESGQTIIVPLEQTYQAAFEVQPRRWRRVLERT